MGKEPKKLLKWRAKQKRGAIMKPETFKKIMSDAMHSGMSKESAMKVAGAQYWNTAEKKYKSRGMP